MTAPNPTPPAAPILSTAADLRTDEREYMTGLRGVGVMTLAEWFARLAEEQAKEEKEVMK